VEGNHKIFTPRVSFLFLDVTAPPKVEIESAEIEASEPAKGGTAAALRATKGYDRYRMGVIYNTYIKYK
jgi:hypothetical protein